MRNDTRSNLLIHIFLMLGFFFLSCGPKKDEIQVGKDVPLKVIILFSVGEVEAGGQAIHSGDIVQGKETIHTGRNSSADLQVAGLGTKAVVRLHENSRFQVSARQYAGKTEVNNAVAVGEAIFNVQKLKKSENFNVVTPSTVAAVRGTRFNTKVDSAGNVTTNVYDGEVAMRPRIQGIEKLDPEVRERSRAIQDLQAQLEQKEVAIHKGESVEIKKKDLQEEYNLKEVEEAVAAAETQKESKAKATSIDEYLIGERKDAIRKSVQKARKLEIKKLDKKSMEEKEKEFEELMILDTPKQDDASIKGAVRERNSKEKAKLMRRIEKIMNKSSEKLILTNGQTIEGVVYQRGSDYIVYTVDGKRRFSASQVEGIAF